MLKVLIFLIGFGFSIVGFMYIITYLNLLSIGYSLKEYFGFIFFRIECILGIVGLAVTTTVIFKKG